jgi:hypothetical protein
MPERDKHSSLVGPYVGYKENHFRALVIGVKIITLFFFITDGGAR